MSEVCTQLLTRTAILVPAYEICMACTAQRLTTQIVLVVLMLHA